MENTGDDIQQFLRSDTGKTVHNNLIDEPVFFNSMNVGTLTENMIINIQSEPDELYFLSEKV